MNRRTIISGLGLSVLGVAGCVGSPPTSRSSNSTTGATDSGSGYVRPQTDPPAVPDKLRCEDDSFTRHTPAYERVKWGTSIPLSLRVDEMSFEYGDTAEIVATNITDNTVSTGTDSDFQFELLTDKGWQDMRGHDDERFLHTSLGLELDPGDTIMWSLHLTEKGVLPEPNYEDLRVCPEFVTGRYRFVFFGVEPAVAVAFDLIR